MKQKKKLEEAEGGGKNKNSKQNKKIIINKRNNCYNWRKTKITTNIIYIDGGSGMVRERGGMPP